MLQRRAHPAAPGVTEVEVGAVGFEVWIAGTGEAPQVTARLIVSDLAERGVQAALLEAGPARDPAGVAPAGPAPTAVGLMVAAASTATLKTVTGLLGRASGRGLVLDLTRTPPRLSDREGLAPRSLLILWRDGRQDLREGLNDEQTGYVARSALATAGL